MKRYCPDAARVGLLGALPETGLTDGFPILVTAQSSLAELNRRLKIVSKCLLRIDWLSNLFSKPSAW